MRRKAVVANAVVRLDEFFDPADLTPSRIAALMKPHPAGDGGPAAAGLSWSAAVQRIAPEVKNLPPIDVPAIAVAAWNQYRTFQAYADPAKYPPDSTIPVPLLEHTITSTHRPSIEVLLNGKRVWQITFELELSFVLTASVAIRAGTIVEIRLLDECRAEGSLKWAGVLLAQRETKPLDLGPVISLKNGIPI